MSVVETAPKNEGTILAEERTGLALQRTVIAEERTLMAWIRTALSMIGFGFSIYNFFRYLPEEIACRARPASAGPAQSGNEPYCPGYCDVSGCGLAAPVFSAPDRGVRKAPYVVDSLCGGDFGRPDWVACVLRCATAQQPVLIGLACKKILWKVPPYVHYLRPGFCGVDCAIFTKRIRKETTVFN